jgi:hypothetical protein
MSRQGLPAAVNGGHVARIIAGARRRENVRTRQREDALREVFVLDDAYVLKRFTWDEGRPPPRPLWQIEHAALARVKGLPLPQSIGYRARTEQGRRIVEYVRTYLPGTPVKRFGLDEARLAGDLLAHIHARRVVTDDALKGNFLRLPDGTLGFVDFGRARVYPRITPAMTTLVGRELAKVRRHCLEHDPERVAAFEAAYFRATPLGGIGQRWARIVTGVTIGLRRLRKGVIQGRPDKA